MFEFLKDRPDVTHRVRVTSATQSRNLDGEMVQLKPGDEIELSPAEAASLVENDKGKTIATLRADGAPMPKKIARPQPVTFTPEPVPARFKDLPACFTQAWVEGEAFRKTRWDLRQAEEVYRKIGAAGGVGEGETQRHNAARDAVSNAELRVRDYNRRPLERALFDCGKAVVSEIRSTNGVRNALVAIARGIFAHRLAALELAASHVDRLFVGSALYQRFVYPALAEHDLRSAGSVQYVDAPLSAMASTVFHAREVREQMNAKFAEAKAERQAQLNAETAARKVRAAA